MMCYGVTLKYKVICTGTSPDTHSSSLTGVIGDMDRGGGSEGTRYFWKWWRRRHKWRWSIIMFALVCVVGDAGVYRQGPPVGGGRSSTEEDVCGTKDLACLRGAHT